MLIDSYLKKVAVDTFLERYYFDMKKKSHMAFFYTIS